MLFAGSSHANPFLLFLLIQPSKEGPEPRFPQRVHHSSHCAQDLLGRRRCQRTEFAAFYKLICGPFHVFLPAPLPLGNWWRAPPCTDKNSLLKQGKNNLAIGLPALCPPGHLLRHQPHPLGKRRKNHLNLQREMIKFHTIWDIHHCSKGDLDP
jgi:hypothetical protein